MDQTINVHTFEIMECKINLTAHLYSQASIGKGLTDSYKQDSTLIYTVSKVSNYASELSSREMKVKHIM